MNCDCGGTLQFFIMNVGETQTEEWLCPQCDFNHKIPQPPDYQRYSKLLNGNITYEEYMEWWYKEGGWKKFTSGNLVKTIDDPRTLTLESIDRVFAGSPHNSTPFISTTDDSTIDAFATAFSQRELSQRHFEHTEKLFKLLPKEPWGTLFKEPKPFDTMFPSTQITSDTHIGNIPIIDKPAEPVDISIVSSKYLPKTKAHIVGQQTDIVIIDEVANLEKKQDVSDAHG